MKKLVFAAAAFVVVALFAVVGARPLAANAGTDATAAFTKLTLINGWTGGGFGTAKPAVEEVNGIVYFKGGMSTTGTNPVPFELSSAFLPSHVVFLSVDLCNATYGRLQIEPTGVVTVQAEGGTFSNAACFTSLDGVSFSP